MFTGIITHNGVVKTTLAPGLAGRVVIAADSEFLGMVKIGDSIAVDGVCLTVVAINHDNFSFDVSPETVAKTTFNNLNLNQSVNLEPALKFGDKLDGHLVSGHVDTVVTVSEVININNNKQLIFSLNKSNKNYLKYIAPKGSITINGVSLTVNTVYPQSLPCSGELPPKVGSFCTTEVSELESERALTPELEMQRVDKFSVNIIPYTLDKTNLCNLQAGDLVNLEIDLFARYSVNYLDNYLKFSSKNGELNASRV